MNAEPDTLFKPPLGIMPERIHKEHRVAEISRAIHDYAQRGKFISPEWSDELVELVRWLGDHPAKVESGVIGAAGALCSEIHGNLLRVGTFEAGGETVTGLLIGCSEEVLSRVAYMPMYRRVTVVLERPDSKPL